ncbi:hypothetical protein B0O80DRAFT_222051 [Mortierella sp. GBAus27b]|nr:hypothetical protein B0O80DRAFT_222051 [Mortierella sp. GBAus27b]
MRKKRTRDAAAANERAEDADEANSVPQTPTLTQDSTQVDRDTAVVGTELNRVLIIEPTPDTPLEPAPEVPLEPTPVAPVESTPVAPVEPTSVAPVEPTPVAPLEPTPVAPLEPTPEAPLDHSERTNPEGYQVCDMETGLCYWVPSNATQPTPAAADQEEKKDETPLIPTPSVDVPSSLISDPAKTLAEPEAPKDHITSSTTPGLAPGLSPRPPRSSSPSPSVSPSASPRIGPTSTHNADGTSSRVGKLSRDRLAMFEKST